jgi:Ca2+-dependent lipid-binding protein
MPCILKVRIISGRDLPVMDKTSELTDAYVEVRFSDFESQRTQICRKSLNPYWNEDFRQADFQLGR